LPKHTRIILIPEDDRRSREYSISRGMVVSLALLVTILAGLVITLLISFAGLLRDARQVRRLQQELDRTQEELGMVRQLNEELEQMRAFQEQLMVMLGVERRAAESAQDTLAHRAEAVRNEPPDVMKQVTDLIMTPPPDLWPLRGFVTREFQEGDAAHGLLPHHGIDLVAPADNPIRAAGKGRVSQAGWDDYLGNFVEIQHGFGYVTVYGHCSRLLVQKGDRIDRSQAIGHLGGTGEASAPHLHFEVWKEGVAVDPRNVMSGEPQR
jgi:murein DD-endopeptidase MepM/ murein hydrolase activator NlpD